MLGVLIVVSGYGVLVGMGLLMLCMFLMIVVVVVVCSGW